MQPNPKRILPALWLLLLVFIPVGCVLLPPQVKDLQKDIYEIKVQVGRLQTLQGDTHKLLSARIKEDAQRDQARFATLTKNQADLEKQIQSLREEVKQSRALLEELRFRLKEMGLPAPESNASPNSTWKASTGVIRSPDFTVTEQGVVIEADALLRSARLDFTNGRYGKARQSLEKFLRYFSKSPQADEALFLLADTYFYEKDYKEALANFRKVALTCPAGSRVPDSLVKAAVCQIELGQKDAARITLKKILKQYPRYYDLARIQIMLKNLEEK